MSTIAEEGLPVSPVNNPETSNEQPSTMNPVENATSDPEAEDANRSTPTAPTDVTTLFATMMARMEELNRQTSARLNELAAAQLSCQDQVNTLHSSETQALERRAQEIQRVQRALFGDSPAPPTTENHPTSNCDEVNIGAPEHETRWLQIRNSQQDEEMLEMRAKLRAMTTLVHQATSSAPEIDRVLKESQSTPFTTRITDFPIRTQVKFNLPTYTGNSDPSQFMTVFSIQMGRARFTPEEKDAGFCQLFVENLSGAALVWFSKLKVNSIDSYQALSTAFLKRYMMYIQGAVSSADLYQIKQGEKESLRSFIGRFNAIVSRITVTDEASLPALRNALRIDSKFRDSLKFNKPRTLEDALHRATLYIEDEEEKESASSAKATPKQQPHKETPKQEYQEPRQHLDNNYRSDNRRGATYNISTQQQQNRQYQNQLNTWQRGDRGETRPFCDYHNKYGHPTVICRELQAYLLAKYRKGEIALSNQPQNTVTRNSGTRPTAPAEQLPPPPPRNEQPNDDIAKRDRENQLRGDTPPASRKKVFFIMGGLSTCNDSVRSIKKYGRQVMLAQKWQVKSPKTADCGAITFTEADTEGVDMPHNDPLVVELRIADCEVSRILVDTGSSVDLIFKETLDKMDVANHHLKSSIKPLTGFDGDTVYSIGTIRLPVYAAKTTRLVKFVVIDKPAIYNVILGTPWLQSMKAVPSTYHQCLKFPTAFGVKTIRGSQEISRLCFAAEHKLRFKSTIPAKVCLTILPVTQVDLPTQERPKQELIVQVNIDESDPERCVGIGADLKEEIKVELVRLLRRNASTFTWSVYDMPGIDPSITSHELNIDPTFKPIKQKRRKLGPEKAQAVNDEVERLSKAGSIIEVKYPEWLANPVVVKKKNGKWRICVDFTDLNKACPKDSFPLPHIDRIVEATAGNELLSFMDAFSGYNQITMHPEDREKTSFITDRGTYCYKVMPFGLKNAGTTYQRR
ncbi:uncharacterized protein LOC112087617 [Eutrema salsugineum]|uniref:uncharacterized protein LOC112087617 n=1 Tax=Eutrema salsugineum TaxID=72664 RepID=UPI000CED3E1B|nr:uncharacterized protein LOC112087617 [Eutrema salsugineum]